MVGEYFLNKIYKKLYMTMFNNMLYTILVN